MTTLAVICRSMVAAEVESAPRLQAVNGDWGFHEAQPGPSQLPRVLLIGDSIVGGYHTAVTAGLQGKAQVDYWTTGLHEGSKELHELLAKVLSHGPYDIIHFNIGLHGWQKDRVPDARYEPLMREYIGILKSKAPHAKLIWCSTTPITMKGDQSKLDPVNNPTIEARDATMVKLANELGFQVDDLYGLMIKDIPTCKGNKKDDQFHWAPPGVKAQAEEVTSVILKCLPTATNRN